MSNKVRKVQQRRAVAVVSALASAALLAGAWGFAIGDTSGTASASAPAPTWTPGGQLPGVAMAATRAPAGARAGVDAALAFSPGVDPSTVREVVAGGTFGFGMRLITARGRGGEPCVSFVTDRGGARQFSCFDAAGGGGALLRFVGDGGTTLGKVEWVNVVGLARSDVARLTLVTQGGSERELPINRWRGFTYSTDVQAGFPASLRAYDADGSVIEEMPTLP
jgi:hypothetical protein